MNNKTFICLIFCLSIIIAGCSKEYSGTKEATPSVDELVAHKAGGATQLSGIGYLATIDECHAVEGFSYAVRMTGELEGCLYTFIEEFDCSPSGTYREEGREYFVGTYKGASGTFWTTTKFEGKYEGCAANGGAVGAEIFGRCQHPIIEGTGTGVFEGVTGRLAFKDDIEAGNFPYRGHFRY